MSQVNGNPDPGGGADELTPTASWWMKVSGNTLTKIFSIAGSSTGLPSFTPGWTPYYEHWFLTPGMTTLSTILGQASKLDFQMLYQTSGNPGAAMIADATSAINGGWTYQTKMKGTLASTDWTAGQPPRVSPSNPLHYFEASGSSTGRPRLLLEVTADSKNFARISWLTGTTTTTGYTASFSVAAKSVPTSYQGLYYYSVATGF